MLHANFTDLSSIGSELLPIKLLHRSNMDFRAFCTCDLDLHLMTLLYKHDPYPLKVYRQTKNELSTSRL